MIVTAKDSQHQPENHTKSLLDRYGMANFNAAYTPGVGQEPSLDQLQATAGIRCSVTYLAYVTRYDTVRGAYGSCKTPTSIFGRHYRPRYHLQPGRFLFMRFGATIRTTTALTVKEVILCSKMMREMGCTLRLRSYLHRQRFNCTCHRHRHLVKLITIFKI